MIRQEFINFFERIFLQNLACIFFFFFNYYIHPITKLIQEKNFQGIENHIPSISQVTNAKRKKNWHISFLITLSMIARSQKNNSPLLTLMKISGQNQFEKRISKESRTTFPRIDFSSDQYKKKKKKNWTWHISFLITIFIHNCKEK